MPRLVIAIGEAPDGSLVGLYVGRDATAGLAAIQAAGAQGAITGGVLFRDPLPDRRISFVRTSAEQIAERAAAARQAEREKEEAAARARASSVAREAASLIAQRIQEAGTDEDAEAAPPPAADQPASGVPPAAPAAEAPVEDDAAAHFTRGRRGAKGGK